MLDIPEQLAVREAVERQTPLRRRICEMLMEDHRRWEVAQALGLSRFALRRHILAIRRSFVAMGFEEWEHPRCARRRRRRRAAGASGPMAIVRPDWRRV